MKTINRYQHVWVRPSLYGLHGNYFFRIFDQSILDLLHEYSFSLLKISTDPKQNKVVFEASERRDFRVSPEECWAFIIIAAISSSARFNGEYKDGSVRRTVIKETEEIENAFDFHHDPDLVRLECSFVLPKEFPIHENFARLKCIQYSKIFSHSRIIYNGREIPEGDTRNKITWFLNLGREHDSTSLPAYEFNGCSGGASWEVSFDFTHTEKQTFSFINGIETVHGGTHVDCVTRAIEQAFLETGNVQDLQFENMTLAVSVHLPPPVFAIIFDACRCCGSDLKLTSKHPEFELMERDLKSQIIKYLSETTERGAK